MIREHYQDIIDQVTMRNRIPRLICLFIGAFIAALFYNAFVVKNNLVYGGIGGLAIIVKNNFGIPTTVFINITTIILIIISLFILGRKKTSYTVIGYFVYAIMINVTEPFVKYINLNMDSFLFSVIIASIMTGVGYGLVYKTGFNTGGADTIVTIVQKYYQFPTAKISNIINGIIVIFGATTFGLTKTIYAIIFLKISNFVSDRILLGVSKNKLCLINTRKLETVSNYLLNELEVGFSILETSNGVGLLKKKMIFCVIPSDRFYDFENVLINLDKSVRIISSDCYTVEGGSINPLIPLAH